MLALLVLLLVPAPVAVLAVGGIARARYTTDATDAPARSQTSGSGTVRSPEWLMPEVMLMVEVMQS